MSTCTLKFVCMSSHTPIKPPTSIKERAALSNAGRGDSVITFNMDGDSSHCHARIIEKFPTSLYTKEAERGGGSM